MLRKTDVLFIDEVSMLSAGTFDLLSTAAAHARGRLTPFGGLQLVVSGDFLQLPPVFSGGVCA